MEEMEMHITHTVETEVADLNENGLLKPHGYLKLFARIAEEHLNRLGLNVDETLKHNLAWALVTMSFELKRPIHGCMRLFATTWHSQKRGPYFRRELEFRDEKGALVFHGSTFSVLMDVLSRSVFRRKEFPFPIHPPMEIFTIEAAPSVRLDAPYHPHERRPVRNSHLDALGHVNNIRYGEFAYDALTEEECLKLAHLRRMDIQFVSELRRGSTFLVEKALQGTQIGIRGRDGDSGNTAFEFVMNFDMNGPCL